MPDTAALATWAADNPRAAWRALDCADARDSLAVFCGMIEIPGAPIGEEPDEAADAKFLPVETPPAAHHKLLIEKLQAVADGKCRRLMVFMPPGSAKSLFASVCFPAWIMGREQRFNVGVATYATELARRVGRRVRSIGRQPVYREIFKTGIAGDQAAANEWALENGNEFLGNGILAGWTGHRLNGLLIDDPVKNREEADSPVIQAKIRAEFDDSLKSRLKPNGFVVLIQCMAGDTPVLMADGSEKSLRAIRIGDAVATYENGKISTSKVLNWINHGPDIVYEIRTACGKAVRANERHPFLTDRGGVLAWVRLRDLRVGDEIVLANGPREGLGARRAAMKGAVGRLTREASAIGTTQLSLGKIPSATTENGPALSAPATAATSLPRAKECARATICGPSGPAGTGRRQPSTEKRSETESSGVGTELELPTMIACSPRSVVCAPFADGETAKAPQGTGKHSLLITATRPDELGGFYVTNATSSSDEGATSTCSKELSDIFAVTKGTVASIRRYGSEDVFDIQVDRTENFLAGGLVSHNTRWAQADLAGSLLPEEWDGESGPIRCRDGLVWEVLCIPAQAEQNDPVGRQPGEMLWPEWFGRDPDFWTAARQNPRTWSALYQQRPAPETGTYFMRQWFDGGEIEGKVYASKRYRPEDLPKALNKYGTSDYAVTEDGGDFTVHRVWGVDPEGELWLLPGGYRAQATSDVWIEAVIDQMAMHKPAAWFGEAGVILKAIEPGLLRRMKERQVMCRLEWLPSITDKATRARGFQARAAMGTVHIPFGPEGDAILDEYVRFPAGRNDDDVDCGSMIGRALDMTHPAIMPVVKKPPELRGVSNMTMDEAMQIHDRRTGGYQRIA